jgi:uncharacterized protein (TIGR03000 family)
MRRRRFTVGALAAVAVAALVLTPNTGQAQRRGGWGGGYSRGGAYYGGQSWGSYGSNNLYFRAGGYGDWSRYGPNYGSNYYGYNRYGYSPGYDGYNQYQYLPNSYGSTYYQGQPMYGQGYYGPTSSGGEGYPLQPGMSGDSYSYGSTAGTAADPNAARIEVRVPENAQLWFEGEKTSQTGRERFFVSPPLTPGKNYTYDVKVQWQENGRDVTKTKQIRVRAGGSQTVEFGRTDEDRSRRDYGTAPSDRTEPFERSAPSNRDENRDRNDRGTNPPDQTAPRNPGNTGTTTPDRSSAPGTARPGTVPSKPNNPPDR